MVRRLQRYGKANGFPDRMVEWDKYQTDAAVANLQGRKVTVAVDAGDDVDEEWN